MKKTLILLLAASFIATSLVMVFAAGTASSAKKPAAKPAVKKTVQSAVCPVMGTKIPDVTKAAGKSVYKGKTYYFCCAGCKPLFDKNPEKYIKSGKAKPAPIKPAAKKPMAKKPAAKTSK
jgi:YHS domain-containing protein